MTDSPTATPTPQTPLTAEQEARLVWLRNLSLTAPGTGFYNEFVALVKKHAAKTNIERQCMIMAYALGMLLPFVDPKKKMTESEANALIRANLGRGRHRAMEQIAKLSNL